jgi:long-chain acyl-CoA synthetase
MQYSSLAEMFFSVADRFASNTAYKFKKDGTYQAITFKEAADKVNNVAGGLAELGVNTGDKVALLSENRLNWAVSDYAILALGAVNVPIYPSLLSKHVEYLINDSESVAIIVSSEDQYNKVKEVQGNCPSLKKIIVMDMADSGDFLTFNQLMDKGKVFNDNNPDHIEKQIKNTKADDMATIIYTSGTTGEPKGAMLMHSNFIANIEGGKEFVYVDENDTFLSFLPLCHVFERMVGHFLATYSGSTIAYAESIETVADNMGEVHPTVMASVPRLYEKIYAKVLANVEDGPGLKRKIFYWAIGVGKKYITAIMNKQPISGGLKFKRNLAFKLVFSKLAERVGGNMRFFASGGAPLSKEIAEFFGSAGLMILEGYGLTETSPIISVNEVDRFRYGTVGHPLNNVEVKIAEDGEILTRGPHVMIGYFNKEDQTKEAIDSEGWFHTGDIGHLDEDGFLKITDRKKNIIVTAGGKNIAPQAIEGSLVLNKYVEQALVVGDNRKFCSAIIVPSFEVLGAWAKGQGLSFESDEQLVKSSEVQDLFMQEVNNLNNNLASYESIKKVTLSDHLFSIESGELTPSLKVKRKVVEENFKDQIEAMYKE